MRPNPSDPSEDISAYIDGELSDDERDAVESAIAEDETQQNELDEIRGLVSLLGGLAQYEPPRSFAVTPEHLRDVAPPAKVLTLLPVVRTLSLAAVVAFVLVSAFAIYDRFGSTDETNDQGISGINETDAPSGASIDSTGNPATEESGLIDRGDSAASNSVPTEESDGPPSDAAASAPGDIAQADATPTQPLQETPVAVESTSESDDDNTWLYTGAGLGALALVLVGLWMLLIRTGRSRR